MDKIKSFCSKDCPDTCGFYAQISSDNRLKIEPTGWEFLDRPFVCRKLNKFYEREVLYNEARSFAHSKTTDTLSAIKEFANFLKSSINKKILYYRGSGNLGYYMYGWDYTLSQLDNVYFTDGNPCDESGIEAHIEDFGRCVNPEIEKLEEADAIIIFGRNSFIVSPHLYAYLKKISKKIVYIDPIKTQSAMLGKFIRIKPGSDGCLAYALIDALGYKRLPNCDSAFEETGISEEDFYCLIKIFRENSKVAIIEGYGLQRYKNGKNSIQWLNRLAYLSGNLDFLFYSRSSKEGLKKPDIKPKNKVFISDIVPLLKDDFFDAIVIVASNPIMSLPDSDIWERAFKEKFLVCVDTNLTETSRLSDIFIKVGGMFSQEDIQGSYFFNKMLTKKAVIDEISDFEAAKTLSELLGLNSLSKDKNILTHDKPKREIYFKEIELKRPYNEKGKTRLISIPKSNYLNSQGERVEEEIIWISQETAKKLDIHSNDHVKVTNGKKCQVFKSLVTDKIAGNNAFVYKSRSLKTNRVFSSIPTDTKRAIAFNDTFVEIIKG